MACDFYSNDPRALKTLVDDHGVKALQFPDDIKEAGAKAAAEIMAELRETDDALTQKTAESFLEAYALLRSNTEMNEGPYIQARQKFYKF